MPVESTTAGRALSGEQLAEVLALNRESDSVELKLTLPESDHRSAVAALGLDPLEAQLRQVVFFDTPDLALDRHGVVVRARRVQGKGDDSVVKLRPVVPADISRKLRKSEAFRVEVDALPGGFVCSGTFKQALRRPVVLDVLGGTLPIHKLFSKEQRDFFRAHAPADIELDDLSVLGPILILKLRFDPKELGRRLV